MWLGLVKSDLLILTGQTQAKHFGHKDARLKEYFTGPRSVLGHLEIERDSNGW